jgi:NB-ARC domain-containing protein
MVFDIIISNLIYSWYNVKQPPLILENPFNCETFRMNMQRRGPQSGRSYGHIQRRRHLSRRRFILSSTVLLLVAGIVVVVLNILNVIHGSWYLIIPVVFTALGLIVAALQWLFPMDPNMTSVTSYSGVIGQCPPSDPMTVSHERVVSEVYGMLSDPAVSTIVMRGISGIGKSTLATLIYQHAEDERLAGRGPFTDKAVWLYIDETTTFPDLAEDLSILCRKSLPDLSILALQNQAEELYKLLNTCKPRLVILDFKNPLDISTGMGVADVSGFNEWLKTLNTHSCSCSVLLTNFPWSRGACEFNLLYMKEYYLKGLSETEGVNLLQNYEVAATEEELSMAVRYCDGHPGALMSLVNLLQSFKQSLTSFLESPAYVQIWTDTNAKSFFDWAYQQLDPAELALLLAFSVYRKPVPIEAAQSLIPDGVPKDQLMALLKLSKFHLFRDLNDKDHYQLHSMVADYAHNHFTNPGAMHDAHFMAAQYYRSEVNSHAVSGQLRHMKDILLLKEAVWHLLQAGKEEDAYALVKQEKLLKNLF